MRTLTTGCATPTSRYARTHVHKHVVADVTTDVVVVVVVTEDVDVDSDVTKDVAVDVVVADADVATDVVVDVNIDVLVIDNVPSKIHLRAIKDRWIQSLRRSLHDLTIITSQTLNLLNSQILIFFPIRHYFPLLIALRSVACPCQKSVTWS